MDTMESVDSQFKNQLEKAARVMANARYAVALVGAGLSVESGIPPIGVPEGYGLNMGNLHYFYLTSFKQTLKPGGKTDCSLRQKMVILSGR